MFGPSSGFLSNFCFTPKKITIDPTSFGLSTPTSGVYDCVDCRNSTVPRTTYKHSTQSEAPCPMSAQRDAQERRRSMWPFCQISNSITVACLLPLPSFLLCVWSGTSGRRRMGLEEEEESDRLLQGTID